MMKIRVYSYFAVPSTWLLPLLLLWSAACSTPSEAVSEAQRPEQVQTPVRTATPRAWEHESSDIPVNTRINFGALPNGLRYAWAENSEPKDRCYVRLHVDVGSLGEEDHEHGMAHFLEHMAFNGSENFEAGTLIKWFQAQGMSFGADTNAHTNFSETVYKLDLPQSDANSLRDGLVVLRDFADGLHLNQEEIDNEKGVIDGEERERDSAGFRLSVKLREKIFDGTRLPDRIPPIGTKEVRERFSAESVRAFYEHWYRPDNMTLVLVGDLQGLNPEALIAEHFQSMVVPNTPLPQEPDRGRVRQLGQVFSIFEHEIPTVSISIARLKHWEPRPSTRAQWIENLPLSYANSMLNLRYRELAKLEGAPYLSASVSNNRSMKIIDGVKLGIACQPERWQEAMAFCERELRRALEHGFQSVELDELRANSLRAFDEAVDREPTAHSGALFGPILSAAESPSIPTSAKSYREIMRPAVEALSVEQCLAALREAWSEGELSIQATGHLDLGSEDSALLLAAYEASRAQPVDTSEEIVVAEFAYGSDPDQRGKIAERRHVEDLDFVQVRFANGVSVNVKRTEFKEKQILIGGELGEGRLTLEPEQSLLEWIGKRVFSAGGLEAHSADELRRLLAGKRVGVSFGIGLDGFSLSGGTTEENLLLECELMCAYLQAPGWREEGLVQLRRSLPLFYENLDHQHSGPMAREFMPALFSGDPRISLHAEEAAMAVEMAPIREWLEPHLARAPLELSFVGDLDVEQTIAIAARTFGMLPERREWRRYEERRNLPAPISGIRQDHTIDTEVPKSLVLIAFPAPDGMDSQVRRKFQMLNTVINDRLRVEVRERLGAAYSPGAALNLSRTYPGVGMVMIQAMSDPDKVDTLLEACLSVADSLVQDGVTEEEIERLRHPELKRLRDAKRNNSYWLGVLNGSQRKPESLDDVRSLDAFLENCKAAELSPLAAEYLQRENASILVVNPK